MSSFVISLSFIPQAHSRTHSHKHSTHWLQEFNHSALTKKLVDMRIKWTELSTHYVGWQSSSNLNAWSFVQVLLQQGFNQPQCFPFWQYLLWDLKNTTQCTMLLITETPQLQCKFCHTKNKQLIGLSREPLSGVAWVCWHADPPVISLHVHFKPHSARLTLATLYVGFQCIWKSILQCSSAKLFNWCSSSSPRSPLSQVLSTDVMKAMQSCFSTQLRHLQFLM